MSYYEESYSESKLRSRVKALEQALEVARKDAERYRWLRGRARLETREGGWVGYFMILPVAAFDDTPYSKQLGEGFSYKSLDAAIDAALKQIEEVGTPPAV